MIVDDCREIENLKILIINLKNSDASDITIQNKIRDCLVKFRADKEKCGIKSPVLAAVQSDKSVTYVKFGDQFCVADIDGAARLLESNQFSVNLKTLI